MARNGITVKTLKPRELDLEPIYIWNQYNLGNVLSTYMTTPISVFMLGPRKRKGILAIQTLGATDLKHCMHTQLTFGVTWVGSFLSTPLPIGVLIEKVPQKRVQNKDWTNGFKSVNAL